MGPFSGGSWEPQRWKQESNNQGDWGRCGRGGQRGRDRGWETSLPWGEGWGLN